MHVFLHFIFLVLEIVIYLYTVDSERCDYPLETAV